MSKSQNQKLFRIHVRPDLKPKMGTVGKRVGNEIVGDSYEAEIALPPQWIPNFYEARVVKKKNEAGKYNGQFDWYDPSTDNNNSEIITVRYLSSCDSLDLKYQEDNGFTPLNENEESGWSYPSGAISDIVNPDERFVDFYTHHEMCASNQMRDNTNLVGFVIIDGEKNVKDKEAELAQDELVLNYRKSIIKSDDRVVVLSAIIGVNPSYQIDDKRNEVLTKLGRTFEEYEKFKKLEDAFHKETLKELKLLVTQKKLVADEKGLMLLGELYFEDAYKSKDANDIVDAITKKILVSEKFYNELLRLKKDIIKNK